MKGNRITTVKQDRAPWFLHWVAALAAAGTLLIAASDFLLRYGPLFFG